ncbi:MAG: penicillin-binding protein 1A [Pseudomonadota bacterium]
MGFLVAVGGIYALYSQLAPQLPSIEVLKDVRLQVPLRVYTQDGDLIAEYGEKRREPLLIEDVPALLKNAYLAAEDDRFYVHPGVDYHGLLRAAYNLIKTGERGQGGSTITMQVARNFFLSREKTYLRKINEIFLSFKIEEELSKDKILELYLNKIYLGNRAYGVGAASKVYYGVPVDQLTLPQVAMLAGLPKAPSTKNPIANPEAAIIRRNYVLGRMRKLDMIDEMAYQEALATGVTAKIHGAQRTVDAGYVGEMARARLVQLFEERAYTAGLKVFTTITTERQNSANRALRNALHAYEERQGYRGAVDTIDAETLADPELLKEKLSGYTTHGELFAGAVIAVTEQLATLVLEDGGSATLDLTSVEWAGRRGENRKGPKPKSIEDVFSVGDVVYLDRREGEIRLAQMPNVEGAFVALDPNDGAIQALVGGFDFHRSKFNRVMQAERQPGSNFKPFIYSAALDKGYTAASIINDAPVVFDDPALEGEWRPENYSGKFFGPTRFREALVKSRNLVSIRLLISIGLRHTMEFIDRFGFGGANLPRDLSLALGSGTLKPIEVARGYATFANNGYLIDPYIIQRVEDVDDTILFEANPARVCKECDEENRLAESNPNVNSEDEEEFETLENYAEKVLDGRNVFIMRSIMRDVVRRGTARRARALGRRDIGGKTGTTNDQHDAWFSGFNDHVVATAWVGYDQQLPLGSRETGGRTALPMWIDYMRDALAGLPESKEIEPGEMTSVLINPKTGEMASADNPDAVFEMFRVEHAPQPSVVSMQGDNKTAEEIEQQDEATEELF